MHKLHFLSRCSGYSLVAGAMASASAGLVFANSEQVPAGQATFIIGKPFLIDSTGNTQPLVRGAWVRPGDAIETPVGTHVHVRFKDGAFVSVRPGSRLRVEEYQFHPDSPKLNTVKFKLENGTARAISGAAAETAKERFRLNTPLVAIGVRGTDFVVSTLGEKTTATVNQGAIVMAPFADGCFPSDLGSCGSSGARLLSADMGNVLAEYTSGLSQPIVKGWQEPGGRALASANSSVSSIGRRAQAASAPDLMANKEPSAPSLTLANTNGAVPSDVLSELTHAINAQPPVRVPPVTQQPPITQQPPVTQQPSAPAVLAWGHWAIANFVQDFSASVPEAADGRKVTVGNDQFVLYRTPGAFAQIPSGNVNFRLDSAFAQYNPRTGVAQAAVVDNGQLSIQFGSRDFTTQLQLQVPGTSTHQFVASGKLDSEGMFRASGTDQSLAGAVAFDTQSAGYLFQKAVDSGIFKGITLWSR